jgi:hypothetical protein
MTPKFSGDTSPEPAKPTNMRTRSISTELNGKGALLKTLSRLQQHDQMKCRLTTQQRRPSDSGLARLHDGQSQRPGWQRQLERG